MNKHARRELARFGTTLEAGRQRLRHLPALGAVPAEDEGRPSECSIYGMPGWEPAEVAARCRAAAGDPYRDRFVAVIFSDAPVDLTRGNCIELQHAKPAALVVRELGPHLAGELARWPIHCPGWPVDGDHGMPAGDAASLERAARALLDLGYMPGAFTEDELRRAALDVVPAASDRRVA